MIKKNYTRLQIVNTIRYWKKQLNESSLYKEEENQYKTFAIYRMDDITDVLKRANGVEVDVKALKTFSNVNDAFDYIDTNYDGNAIMNCSSFRSNEVMFFVTGATLAAKAYAKFGQAVDDFDELSI